MIVIGKGIDGIILQERRVSSPLAPRVLSRRLGKLSRRPRNYRGRPKCRFSTTGTGNSSGSVNSIPEPELTVELTELTVGDRLTYTGYFGGNCA